MGRRESSAAKKSRKRKRRAARRSASKEESVVQMDETIWKDLPEELLETVISKVPIATILRFRSVCHKWNSSPFLQRWVPPELPLIYAFVASDDKPGSVLRALYDPCVKKWYFSTHIPQHCFDMLAPGRELVCYLDRRDACFHIGNLLTRNWKVYPCSMLLPYWMPGYSYAFVDNLVGYGGYKIIWVKLDEGQYGVDEYSTEKSVTITKGSIPDSIVRHKFLIDRGMAIGSVAYFRGGEPNGIMCYDMVRGAWEQLLIPYPPKSDCISLADGGGRLWLVGQVYDANAQGISVCVWELDTRMRSWIEVARMPTCHCSKLRHISVYVACLSIRRLLVISLSGWKRRKMLFSEVFAYDVVSRKWSKLPECIPPYSKPQWPFNGFCFFTSLSASL